MRFAEKKLFLLTATLAFTLVLLFSLSQAQAGELLNRSVSISNPQPAEASDHLYTFDFPGGSTVGSIAFEYCENTAVPSGPCTPPPGFTASGASLDFQSGETGFGIHPNTTANRLVLSRPPTVPSSITSIYVFSNIINPTTTNDTVYVRTYLYPTTDATGASVDFGAMAFSTSESIVIGAYVPPYLLFCTALSVNQDCTITSGNFINFGELLPTLPSLASSQYSGATNDDSGYTVSVYGTTMTSGNNVIPALSSQSPSSIGVSQFGINLRDNVNPDVGIDPSGPGTATITANYDSPNLYRFSSGDVLSSANISSSYDQFTVSYVVNVDDNQAPGIYATTLTYVALASF